MKTIEILVTKDREGGWSTQMLPGSPNWRHVLTYPPIIDYVKKKIIDESRWKYLLREMRRTAPDKESWHMYLTNRAADSLVVIEVPTSGILIIEDEGLERVFLQKDLIPLD